MQGWGGSSFDDDHDRDHAGNLDYVHGYGDGDDDDDEEYIVLKLDYFQPCTGQHAFHPLLLTQSILFNNRDVDDVGDFSHLLF